jgi:hypothetical protein
MLLSDKRKRRDNDEDDDEILEDGQSYRVPIHLMDARQRSVHAQFSATDLRDLRQLVSDSRREMIDQQSRAWTMGRHVELPPQRRAMSLADAQAMRREAREAYIARISDAWRTQPTGSVDAAQPDLGGMRFTRVSPQEFLSALNRAGPGAAMLQPDRPDYEAIRRRANDEYVNNLQNAWRTPVGTGSPNRATEVERQRRLVTHEDRR